MANNFRVKNTDLAKKVGEIDASLAHNTQQIEQLQSDIGTIENIAELQELINSAGDINAYMEDTTANRNEIEGSRVDFNNKTHDNLSERLDSDMIYINDRFNNASLLEYEDKYITANESYDGFTKDLKIKGRTIKNLIKNGDFSNGTTGWISSASNLSSISNTLSIASDGSQYLAYAQQTFSMVISNKIYAMAKVRVTNSDCTDIRLRALNAPSQDFGKISTPIAGQWYSLSGIITPSQIGTGIAIRHDYVDSATASGKVMEVQQVSAYDLTEMFGSGNEPSKEWCDANLPFVDGIKSVGETEGNKIEVLSCGKNLFNKNNYIEQGGSSLSTNIGGSKTISSLGDTNHRNIIIKLPVGKTYSFTIDKRKTHPNGWTNYVVESNNNGIVIGGTYRTLYTATHDANKVATGTFTTTMPYIIIHAGVSNSGRPEIDYATNKQEALDSLQIEESKSPSEYEPYKEDKITIQLNEPLRGLPNGVKDEVDLENGKVIRRVGKVVLDGSDDESWTLSPTGTNELATMFQIPVPQGAKKRNPEWGHLVICDKLSATSSEFTSETYHEGIRMTSEIYIRLSNTSLDTLDVNGVRAWLEENPLVVCYELETPIEAPIEAPNNLRTYDGTTHLFTEGNAVEPNIYAKIPSDVNSIVKTLQAVNSKLEMVIEQNSLKTISLALDQEERLTKLELGVI